MGCVGVVVVLGLAIGYLLGLALFVSWKISKDKNR